MRVLIVEDEVIIAMHIAMMVTDFGYRVCATAASASEAIALAGMHNPDIALMDLRLSGGSSGIDAVRELYGRHALRCIIVSANIDESTRLALSPYEPIAFVEKPVLPVILQSALKEAKYAIDL
jgi:DNA-binding NarL/FixJ family response regulator